MRIERNEIRISDFESHRDGLSRFIYINRHADAKFRIDVTRPAGSASVILTPEEMISIAQEILDMAGVTNVSFTHPPKASQ